MEQIVISYQSDSEPVDSSASDSESENSSNILPVEPPTPCELEDLSASISEPEETGDSQDGQVSDNYNTTIEPETEQSKVDQARENTIDASAVIKNTSAKYWKQAKNRSSGKPGVVCPGCQASTGGETIVLLRKICDHFVRVHSEILSQSLLCPYCETAVLPSDINSHILAGCTDVPHFWELRERKHGGLFAVVCPWCKDHNNNHVNLSKFSRHVARKHDEKCSSSSLQCPTCKEALLPSQVRNHMPCVDSASA